MGYKPPKIVQENAKIARECIRQGSKAMTPVGRYRSAQLASGRPVSMNTLKRMSAFGRHRKNASYKGNPCKDRGFVAWHGWGGDEGIKWARGIIKNNA